MNSTVAAACTLLLAVAGTSAIAAPDQAGSPCGFLVCPSSFGADAERLNMAYFSGATSDDQRTKMRALIAAHSKGSVVDWSGAAKEYFAWRASFPPAVANATLDQSIKDDRNNAEAQRKQVAAALAQTAVAEADRERRFRRSAEAAIKARLIDPNSAEFDWPYGFVYGTWKPLLSRRIEGYFTCGRVNARNRLGGYAGASAFVVVLSADGELKYVDVGTSREFDFTEAACAKTAKMLPPATSAADEDPATPVASVADELDKLASLRDRGIITPAEFDAQKAKLLGEH